MFRYCLPASFYADITIRGLRPQLLRVEASSLSIGDGWGQVPISLILSFLFESCSQREKRNNCIAVRIKRRIFTRKYMGER